MRPLLNVLTLVLFVIGFFVPLVWVLAVISAVSAIVSASDGPRADARARSSGVIDGIGDNNAGSHKSKSCPACLGTVSRFASKCQYCGEILEVASN
jgi:hypothetical protein